MSKIITYVSDIKALRVVGIDNTLVLFVNGRATVSTPEEISAVENCISFADGIVRKESSEEADSSEVNYAKLSKPKLAELASSQGIVLDETKTQKEMVADYESSLAALAPAVTSPDA